LLLKKDEVIFDPDTDLEESFLILVKGRVRKLVDDVFDVEFDEEKELGNLEKKRRRRQEGMLRPCVLVEHRGTFLVRFAEENGGVNIA
jgi:hypothetical protein